MKLATIGRKGMAKDQKEDSTPTHIIEAPQALVPLMQAFHVNSEKDAKSLIITAAKAIYGHDEKDDDFFRRDRKISKSEMDGVISLMKCVNPRDSLETLYAAQIVARHMLGNAEARRKLQRRSKTRIESIALQQ